MTLHRLGRGYLIPLALFCSIACFADGKRLSFSGLSFQSRRPSSSPAADVSPAGQPDSPQSSSSSDTLLIWKEDTVSLDQEEPSPAEQEARQARSKTKRRLFWCGHMEDKSYDPRRQSSSSSSMTTTQPHALRMKQWNFTVAWKEHKRDRNSELSFDFHENGYVRCLHPSKTRQTNDIAVTQHQKHKHKSILDKVKVALGGHREATKEDDENSYVVGTWKLAPSGVMWNMAWDGKHYSFYADLHANPFGRHPKMFRGLVIRDRCSSTSTSWMPKRFLRPIVATFSGIGVGEDTADFSYKDRGPPKQ